jgi:hypothetical protein
MDGRETDREDWNALQEMAEDEGFAVDRPRDHLDDQDDADFEAWRIDK